MIRPGIRRLFRLPVRRGAEEELDEEIRLHLELRAEQLERQGLPAERARAEALRRFGPADETRRTLRRAARRREGRVRSREWLDALAHDLRFGARHLLRSPGFSAVAVLTLALGICATVSFFSVVNGVLLRPLPFRDPDRLALVWTVGPEAGADALPFSAGNFLDLRRRTRAFERLAAFRGWSAPLSGGGESEIVDGVRASAGLFETLGVRPLLGRGIAVEDDREGAERVVVLSHALWRRRWGGSPAVLGERVALGGNRYTVVGVMPAGFDFPRGAELPAGLQFAPRTEFWVPLAATAAEREARGTLNLAVVGRLRPGVSREAAAADLAAAARGMAAEFPPFGNGYGMRAVALQDYGVRGLRTRLWLLLGAGALVLLVACANIAGLLVTRGLGRTREVAIRGALGASSGRVVRQLVTEGMLLSAAGAALGVLMTRWATRAAVGLLPPSLPRLDAIGVDARVLALAVLLALATGTALGWVAAAYLERIPLTEALHGGGRTTGGARQQRFRNVLVALQVSLSCVLLVCAALLAGSFGRLQRTPPGFRTEGVLTAGLGVAADGSYDPEREGRRWVAIHSAFLERVAALPGVRAVGGVSALPLSGAVESFGVVVEGRPEPPPGEAPQAEFAVVAGDYFRAMAIPVRRGRALAAADRADAPPVVVVNETLARRFWPGEDPVGKRLRIGFDRRVPREVVGVVGDVRQTALEAEPNPTVYLPLAQTPYPFLTVVAHAPGRPESLAGPLRRELRAVDPALALEDVRVLDEVLAASLARRRFSLALVGACAAATFVLALVGLYGALAFTVGMRTREIGVRMALGARPADAVRLVLREGVRVIATGLVAGLAASLLLTRLLRSQLVGVGPTDPAAYAAVVVLLGGMGLLACWIPARRTSRVDPLVALRAE